jgi:hypothetical protein
MRRPVRHVEIAHLTPMMFNEQPADDSRSWQVMWPVGSMLRSRWHTDGLLGIGGAASIYSATHRNGLCAYDDAETDEDKKQILPCKGGTSLTKRPARAAARSSRTRLHATRTGDLP